MSPSDPVSATRSRPWPLVALLSALGISVAFGFWHRDLLREGVEITIGSLRSAGPLWFFGAMAMLPSFGFPLLPFALAAGPVFGPSLGTVGVIVFALSALACNVTLSYVIATKALRPWAARLLTRWGHGDVLTRRQDFGWRWVLFVRLAPGLPFFVQSYLLGLTRARFIPYLVFSTAVPGTYIAGTIWFGDTLWRAEGRNVVWLVGIAVATLLFVGWLRKFRRPCDPTPPLAGS